MSGFKNHKPVIKKSIVQNASKSAAKPQWWNVEKNDVHNSVFAIVNKLNSTTSIRHLSNIKFARLYENMDVVSYALGFYDTRPLAATGERSTWNIVASCIDTVANKISKSKPKIEFMTEGGNYKLQTKAENLTQYLEGLFDLTNTYEVAQEAFIDACKFGTGCIYVYADEDFNIQIERVLISEIVVDEAEGLYRKPKQLHRRKLVQRDSLKAMFPEYSEQIDSAQTINIASENLLPPDMVLVVESWHLKSSSKSTDGRHAISINNCTLALDNYDKKDYPFRFFRWKKRTVGFFGMGLAEELAKPQVSINKLMRMIEVAQETMAVPRAFVEVNSDVSIDAMSNNGIGDIVTYSGTPPIFSTPAAISPDIYSWVQQLKQSCYELCGVSQLSAMSKKPEGLDSGIALSTYEDIQTERMSLTALLYEQFFIDIGKLMIDLQKDASKDNNNKGKVKVVGDKFIKTLNWNEVDMDDDEYVMRGFPASLLPSTPAGRLSTIIQLIQAGLIPKQYSLSLLKIPDLDKFTSLQTAALNNIHMLIGQMLDEGKYVSPTPIMDLQLCATEVHSALLDAQTKTGIPKENIDLLQKFLVETAQLATMAAGASQSPGAAPAAPAPGVGAPPPVSQLLPNQAPPTQ